MRTNRRRIVIAVLAVTVLLIFFRSCLSSPLPHPPRFTEDWPRASPPAEMAIFRLPTGVTHRSAAFAYRGGSFFDKRDFTMTAVLVKHPRGDLLIDTGFGRNIDAHFRMMPFFFRATTSYEKSSSASERLAATGYDEKSLKAIVLTHAHWDHVSGVPDFPNTPVWVTAEERRFIEQGGFTSEVARSFRSARYEEYGFEGGPYLGFKKSRDVYGDGSIVIVPAPGHTPGSVIVFLTLPSARRYALIGDLAWQREGVTWREERPWLQRSLADVNEGEVRENLGKMSALSQRFPDLVLVPAHDVRGFADMPAL